jgi:hypothetical protein
MNKGPPHCARPKGETMTIRVLAVLVILVATAAAADKPATNKKKVQKATPAKVQPVTIPPDAVQVDPNTYRYTDPAGKKWTYYRTPFGISRMEDNSVEAAKRAQEDTAHLIESTKAVEDGDSIQFERASPFGTTHWKRNKAELNETERAVWEHELQKRAEPENAANANKD